VFGLLLSSLEFMSYVYLPFRRRANSLDGHSQSQLAKAMRNTARRIHAPGIRDKPLDRKIRVASDVHNPQCVLGPRGDEIRESLSSVEAGMWPQRNPKSYLSVEQRNTFQISQHCSREPRCLHIHPASYRVNEQSVAWDRICG
jgi:hypothetical protein